MGLFQLSVYSCFTQRLHFSLDIFQLSFTSDFGVVQTSGYSGFIQKLHFSLGNLQLLFKSGIELVQVLSFKFLTRTTFLFRQFPTLIHIRHWCGSNTSIFRFHTETSFLSRVSPNLIYTRHLFGLGACQFFRPDKPGHSHCHFVLKLAASLAMASTSVP